MNQNIHTNEMIKQLSNKVDFIATHNKILETQISQLAQQQAATTASSKIFPSQPQPNPKEHANDITLRSSTELDGYVDKGDRTKYVEYDVEKESVKEPITIEKESEQTSKAKEVAEKDK